MQPGVTPSPARPVDVVSPAAAVNGSSAAPETSGLPWPSVPSVPGSSVPSGVSSTSGVTGADAAAAQAAAPPARTAARVRSWRGALRLALLFFVLGIFGNEILVATAAGRVARFVPTRELGQLADVWDQYDELSHRSYLHMGTRSLARSLTQQTANLAEQVIADYRTPLPTVREAQWSMAREALAHAVALAPGNPQLRAALRYCEGHLHRINGDARKSRKQGAAAQRDFTDAVTAFREAAELRPKWPDPFLGLTRTFIYGLEDVDRGADALNQAQQYGYVPGERETAQLGDGYRARADTLARKARQLANMPTERDYLARAAEAYRQALTLYAKAADFAGVPATIGFTQRSLSQVQRRLVELSLPAGESGAAPGASNDHSSTTCLAEVAPWA